MTTSNLVDKKSKQRTIKKVEKILLVGLLGILLGGNFFFTYAQSRKAEIERRKAMDVDDLYKELKNALLEHVSESFFPGGVYKDLWARDAMHITRGLIAIKEYKKAKDILEELAKYQLGEKIADYKIVRGRGSENLGYKARVVDIEFVLENDGALPTTIYSNETLEIYGENPDIDSTALWIIEACEYVLGTDDLDFAKRNYGKIIRAFKWLKRRDIDGDSLLEQGENEDQQDCLRRRGKVTFSQALWFQAVNKLSRLEKFLNHKDKAFELKDLMAKIRKAINEKLWLKSKGYYADYIDEKTTSNRLNQDTSLLITFGIAPKSRAKIMLNKMDELLWNEYGAVNLYPPYEYKETAPLKLPPGTYLNSAVWPWICGYEISARFAVGNEEKANELLRRVLPYYLYEWIDPKKGTPYGAYPFATNMGVLLDIISTNYSKIKKGEVQ